MLRFLLAALCLSSTMVWAQYPTMIKGSQHLWDGIKSHEVNAILDSLVDPRDKQVYIDLEGITIVVDKEPIKYLKYNQRNTYISNGTIKGNAGYDGLLMTGHVGRNMKVGGWTGSNEDINQWMDALHLDDMVFMGGGTQLEIVGSSMSTLDNVLFQGGDIGLSLIFALQTQVNSCRFILQKEIGAVVMAGLGMEGPNAKNPPLEKANLTNSQSNHCIFRGCRWYQDNRKEKPPFASLACYGTNGLSAVDCVFEGSEVEYGIYSDHQGSNTTVQIEVINPHVEYRRVSKAVFHLSAKRQMRIAGYYSQTGGTQFEFCAPKDARVVIENVAFLNSGDPIVSTGEVRNFTIINSSVQVWYKPETWCDGELPKNLMVIDGGIIGFNESITLKNKYDHVIQLLPNGEEHHQLILGSREKKGTQTVFKNGEVE